jgi:hypothetical protein
MATPEEVFQDWLTKKRISRYLAREEIGERPAHIADKPTGNFSGVGGWQIACVTLHGFLGGLRWTDIGHRPFGKLSRVDRPGDDRHEILVTRVRV